MMNFDNCVRFYGKSYGGKSCNKHSKLINNELYMVKYPKNLANASFTIEDLSYSNTPTTEYIGSHIFESLGMSVHETILGRMNDRIAVACKDFVYPNKQLMSMQDMLNGKDDIGEVIDEYSDLDVILYELQNSSIFQKVDGVVSFFWKMFVVDAFIGNVDRNEGNWGLVADGNQLSIAPVFDNGACLNPNWSISKMEKYLASSNKDAIVYKGRICYFTRKGKKINPYKLIASYEFADCDKALEWFLGAVSLDKCFEIIDSVETLSPVQNEFYKDVLQRRLDYLSSCSVGTSNKTIAELDALLR